MVSTLVRRTAKELAGAFHSNADALGDGRYVRTDQFRAVYGNDAEGERRFIREQWPKFVKQARYVLGIMLRDPGRRQSEKDYIYDQLLKDQGHRTDEEMIAPSIMRLN